VIRGRPLVEVDGEFEGAELGDVRLNRRLARIVRTVSANPAASFPKAMVTEDELEGLYRFLNNDRVSFEELVMPHVRATASRTEEHDTVLVVHDTSTFSFQGEAREGLGPLQRSGVGFIGHFALALVEGEERIPLGVLGAHAWVRDEETATKKRRRGADYLDVRGLPTEQDRWRELVDDVEEWSPGENRFIHVMDSEADDYKLFAGLVAKNRRFVIRLCYDRVLADQDLHLKEYTAAARTVYTRTIKISRRRKTSGYYLRKRSGPRTERKTELAFSATSVTIQRPSICGAGYPKQLELHVVRVREINPPKNVEPIDWILATTEPIKTKKQILRIVDIYRSRWTIEEFFKAIKTGCAFEKRQLESWEALTNALAIFIPIAWNLLRMRSLGRHQPEAPARMILTDSQIHVLSLAAPLPKKPTIQDALSAIARLGGHLKRNGPPGWQLLGRGYTELLAGEAWYRRAKNEQEK